MKNKKTKNSVNKLLLLMCLGVIVLWAANFFVLYCYPAGDSGTYGDMFGAINSLFTGLAFAGLVSSIVLQQKQLNQMEQEADVRRKNERESETLKQCQYYLTEIQASFSKLSMAAAQGLLPRGLELEDITYEGLKKKQGFYETIVTSLNAPSDILLTLRKLEAFAAIMLHGNTKLMLGGRIIGEDYCVWVNNLSGFIAFYRKGDDMNFCEHILNLRDRWKK